MSSQNNLASANGTQLDLGRSSIAPDSSVQLTPPETGGGSSNELDGTMNHSLVSVLTDRKHHAAAKVRKILHMDHEPDSSAPDSSILAGASQEASYSRLVQELPTRDNHIMKDFVHNPVDTIKAKVSHLGNAQVAATIAAKEVTHGQDVDLVIASDKVKNATTKHERLVAAQDASRLMEERQAAYARWSLDRHITKVRRPPQGPTIRKAAADFSTKNLQGRATVDWRAYGEHLLTFYAYRYGSRYIGYGSEPPVPSKESIIPNVERLIVATSPFQELIMTIRRVYCWESPVETTKYLIIYLILWHMNLLLSGMLSALLYLVLSRRIRGTTIEILRKNITRIEDTRQIALSLNELIEKQGADVWGEKIVQEVGPWLMVQLADLANFFETCRNFYEWREPKQTTMTLSVLAAIILVTLLTPLWLLVKTTTLGVGFTFFALFPLAANFPEYRLLVSPTKRLMWEVPTHAEWAIQYIQAEGARIAAQRSADRLNKPTPSSVALPTTTTPASAHTQDYGFYKSFHDNSAGRLIISTSSCRFESNIGHDVHFLVPYQEIAKLEKQVRIVAKSVSSKLTADTGKDLKLVLVSGHEYIVQNLAQRDEAFTQVVGFSRTAWQVVW